MRLSYEQPNQTMVSINTAATVILIGECWVIIIDILLIMTVYKFTQNGNCLPDIYHTGFEASGYFSVVLAITCTFNFPTKKAVSRKRFFFLYQGNSIL